MEAARPPSRTEPPLHLGCGRAASCNPSAKREACGCAPRTRRDNHPRPAHARLMPQFGAQTLIYLRALREQFPTAEAALAEISGRRATLTLPKGTIHVISDVHGEDVKLK